MRKLVQKITAGALALCMAGSLGVTGAFAADGVPTGTADDFIYSCKLNLKPDETLAGMFTALVDTDAYVTVNGEKISVTGYAVSTMPDSSPSNISELTLTMKDLTSHLRLSKSRITDRTFDLASSLLGIQAGDRLMAAPFVIMTDADGIGELKAGVPCSIRFKDESFAGFILTLSDFVKETEAGQPVPKPGAPTETGTDSAMITADVAAPAPEYRVVIPELVAMGTLSPDQVNTEKFAVAVFAENLGSGYVQVSSAAGGLLNSGENTLAYTNSFGTQRASDVAQLEGAFSVTAEAVQAAAAGNYTGTASFDIAYFAAE